MPVRLKHDVPAEALNEFKELKQLRADERELEKSMHSAFEELHAKLTKSGVLPISWGRTTMTEGVDRLLQKGSISVEGLYKMLDRHAAGDFGDVGIGDKVHNLNAVPQRDYLLSRYDLAGHSFYVEMLEGWEVACVMLRNER